MDIFAVCFTDVVSIFGGSNFRPAQWEAVCRRMEVNPKITLHIREEFVNKASNFFKKDVAEGWCFETGEVILLIKQKCGYNRPLLICNKHTTGNFIKFLDERD